VDTLVHVARVIALLLLAWLTVVLVMALTSDTGVIEKAVLLALIGLSVVLAAKISTLATQVSTRLTRR
jgi:hypothetical protein